MARDPIVKRKYPKAQIPGTMGHSAYMDTTGLGPEFQGIFTPAPAAPKPKQSHPLQDILKSISGFFGGNRK